MPRLGTISGDVVLILVYLALLAGLRLPINVQQVVTDTLGNERTFDPEDSGISWSLHCALMRNLGIAMTEACWLDDLAAACAADRRWDFLYTAAPLKVTGASGAPVNPVVIR